jgi:RHS repeat-associated protein
MLTGLAGKILTYDGENRPLSVTWLGRRTCYFYGVDGQRLKKVEGLPHTQDFTALPANVNATVYFGTVELRNWKVAGQEQVLTYPHLAVKLLNGATPAVATYFYRDGLSSVRAITNAAGAKIEAALYKPFGEQSEWVLPGNAALETKGWIGERYDADAGLQYLNARYYDPELSLFLQPDWFEVSKAGVGTNRYSYSFNDPVNNFDPGGNESAKKKTAETALKALKEAKDQAKKQAFETAKTQAAQRFASRANTVHKSGVPFDANGFPDFSNYRYKGGKSEVIIKYLGKRDMDEILANKAAGYKDTPEGYTWHHHQDFGKMKLVEKGAHKAVGHTGGFRFSEAAVQAGGSFDAAIQAAEKVLNSHTMRALELFDPTTYLDLMYESQTGYSIWDSEEKRWDKWCGSNPDRCT